MPKIPESYFRIQKAMDDVVEALHDAAEKHDLTENYMFLDFVAQLSARIANTAASLAHEARREREE